MTEPLVHAYHGMPAFPMPPDVPSDFTEITEAVPAGTERKLGYFGQARFVLFYYEPRGGEVIWKDDWSYGFGTGAWSYFMDHVAPLATRYGVDLGSDEMKGSDVLLIDRLKQAAYFAERKSAEQFLSRQRSLAHQM